MTSEIIEKCLKVKARVDDGETIKSACEAENLGFPRYYQWKKGKSPTAKPKKAKLPDLRRNFVEVPLKTTQPSVAIVVCQPDQIKSILEGLQ